MLIYHRPVPPKIPKRRSRAGCIHCKEKKKKCTEVRPQCDRCMDRGLRCEYEPVKPRKRRRTMSAVEAGQPRSHVTSDPGHSNGFPPDFPTSRQSSSSTSPIMNGWESDLSTAGSSTSSCGDRLDDSPLPLLGPYGDHIPTCSAGEMFSVLSRPKTPYVDLPTLVPASNGSPYHSTRFRASPTAFLHFTASRSRQTLLAHFSEVLSPLLVFREEPSNPFVDLVLPMAQHSQVVMYAVLALSSTHMEYQGIENDEKSLDLHSKAIQGLTQLIAEREKANRDEVLAVIMLLVYYEVVRGGSSAIINGHLKGALSIMKARRSSHGPTGHFLEKAFRYFDVICALSFGTPPISGSLAPLPPPNLPSSPSPGTNVLAGVDNLFGFVADLWPVVHRLGTLLDVKRQIEHESSINLESASRMQKDFENTTVALELALHQWIPKLPGSLLALETSADDHRLQSILNNAEAYRQASLVYLFRTVLGYPRMSSKVQAHAKQALQACLRVVVFTGPMAALLWPLFVASCEAVDETDQSGSRSVFKHLEQRQSMQNIAFAWDIAEDIWRRREHDRELDWRDVTDDQGRSIVFG